jgi:hypothetical protein
MRELLLILFVSVSFFCNGTNYRTLDIKILENLNTLPDFKVDSFKTTKLVLDTTTTLQNQYFEADDSLFFGYEKDLIWVLIGEKQLGYVVFTKDKELLVALTEWKDGSKVIGIAKLPRLRDKEELISCRYPVEHQCESLTFGVIELVGNDIVRTIRAWQINENNRTIEQISPSAVDFTDSYNTDAD